MNALKRILNWLLGKSVTKKVTPKPTAKPQVVTPKTEIKPIFVPKVETPKVQEVPVTEVLYFVVAPTPIPTPIVTPLPVKPAAPKRKRGPRKPSQKK